MSEQHNFEEIDIMALLAKGYTLFIKNILLFIFLPLGGLGIALALAYSYPQRYSSNMLIETELLTSTEVKFIVEELKKSDSIPGITWRSTGQRVSVSFEALENETRNANEVYLTVKATVENPSIFPQLEQAIVAYLNGTRAIAYNRHEKEVFYKSLIARIDSEISSLDKIKQEVDPKAISNYLSPADLFVKTVDLYGKRQEYEMILQDIQSVHIIKGFQSLGKDVRLSKSLSAIVGFVIGFLLVVIILFIKTFNKYYKSRMTS